jgi:glyoxylase-like metal-dependent hydrolase (beta-lactamase superfamily II)
MVCHVLLVETANGLVLIDSGFGTRDCADPARRVGPSRHLIRPVLDAGEAAVNQIGRLGFRPGDVRHIVVTHFDGDHIGGIYDFPDAHIHVTAAEALGALRAPSRGEKVRFRPVHGRMGRRSSSTPRPARSGAGSPRLKSSMRWPLALC